MVKIEQNPDFSTCPPVVIWRSRPVTTQDYNARVARECVPHVQHDYFSSFNQSDHCFLASSLLRPCVRFPTGTRAAGRLRTAEWRKNVARHCAFLVLWGIFFVILPSSVFLPSCCVRSLISNQIRFWFLISGEGPNIRCTWLDFVDLDARITWPCLRIRLTWSQFLWLGFCTIWLSKSLGQRSTHST